MKLIGLTGQAGSGKDTVADFLCETHGFVQIAFADPIRAGLKAMFGLTDDYFTDRKLKERTVPWIGRSPRELMQTLGTEWGRKLINRDIWISLAETKVKQLLYAPDYLHVSGIVISDVRLENEATWIRSQGGEIWHIWRMVGRSTLTAAAQSHSSEKGIAVAYGDRIIHNNSSTIEVLHELIHTIITNEEEAS
jgi:hypothetical protein